MNAGQREVGSQWGISFVLLLARCFGRSGARGFLRLLALYYLLTHAAARRASRDYLMRVGAAAGFWSSYEHILSFAECALDRALLLQGRTRGIDIVEPDADALQALRAMGQGALLLGAHVGSFEMLRTRGMLAGLVINVVADFDVAPRLRQALDPLGPNSSTRYLSGALPAAELGLRIAEAIARGELVAVLADRPDRGRGVRQPFLGETASFPSGPHALALALGCPTFLSLALYTRPNHYQIVCEPLAPGQRVPRSEREPLLQQRVAQYAQRLEEHCRKAPYNWFNFFDFWATGDSPTR